MDKRGKRGTIILVELPQEDFVVMDEEEKDDPGITSSPTTPEGEISDDFNWTLFAVGICVAVILLPAAYFTYRVVKSKAELPSETETPAALPAEGKADKAVELSDVKSRMQKHMSTV